MRKAFIDTSVLLRMLVRDDDLKARACQRLLKESKQRGLLLYLLPVVILEIVWVLEKVYKFDRKQVRELVDAILNTPELKVELDEVFRRALVMYEEKNVKFADAVMGYWGLERNVSTVFTYDEKDFKRIEGLEVHRP